VETLEDAVFSIDLDGRVNFISAAVERMTSYTVAEIVGRPFSDFIHPDDLAGVLDRYQRALRGETLAYEYRLLDRDGRVVHVQTRSHLLLRDGVTVGLAGLITDITTRKRAEEDLHIKDAAIHSSISPIGLADLEGRIIYVNRAFCRLWRYSSPEEIMGRPFSGFAESPESGVKALEALLTTGAYVGEQEARSRDGARIDVQVSASVVTDPAGRPLCLMASFLDITDRKAADARLRASLTEKETLLKEIHHRVKNNLQIINSLLSLQANEITDPVFQEVFRESQHRVRAMALVHEQLYRSNDLARIDFGDYLHNVTSQLAASFGKETIGWSVASDAVSFAIDTAIPCGLVASELVTNALKHAFVGRSRGSISVTLQREEGTMLALRVADDGVGFPAELDFAAVRSMGASLIRALVSQLGGTLAVERGSGTTIVVRFPVAEDGAADPSA
jgi:PAS domain S-box-containing protein